MSQRKKILLVVLSIVALTVVFAAAITGYVMRTHSAPVPNSMEEVRKFADAYAPVYIDENVQSAAGMLTGLDFLAGGRPDNLIMATLDVNGSPVILVVGEFNRAQAAEEAYHSFRRANAHGVRFYSVSYHVFSRGYWTASIRNGNTFASWVNDRWLVIISGKTRQAVKDLEANLKRFLEE